MKLERFEDWPHRLAQTIEDARSAKFEWGMRDCLLFGSDCVHAMTGHDFMAAVRGTYSTAMGAAKALRQHGFDGPRAAITAHLGAPLAAPLMMQRGDAGLVLSDEGLEVGCINHGDGVVCLAETGLAFFPLSRVLIAWRV